MLNELILGFVSALILIEDDFHLSSFAFENNRPERLVWGENLPPDIGVLYKPHSDSFKLEVGSTFIASDNIIINNRITYSSASTADAISVPSAVSISASVDYSTNDNEYWSIEINNVLTFSRQNRDFACVDSFKREFHCATAIPFSDDGVYTTRRKYEPSFHISKTWLF
jgi:hypothetical protein